MAYLSLATRGDHKLNDQEGLAVKRFVGLFLLLEAEELKFSFFSRVVLWYTQTIVSDDVLRFMA